jgi:hypothetical protein
MLGYPFFRRGAEVAKPQYDLPSFTTAGRWQEATEANMALE